MFRLQSKFYRLKIIFISPASHPDVTIDACQGRVVLAEHQVISCKQTSVTNTYATSCRKERSGAIRGQVQ